MHNVTVRKKKATRVAEPNPTLDLNNDNSFPDVEVGRGTYWDFATWPFLTFGVEKVIVGRYCSIAAGVRILAGGEHYVSTPSTWPFDGWMNGVYNPSRAYRVIENTVIGSDVWIGAGALVVGGAQIGHGAVIGAGAVVRGSVPPYGIVVGNPAALVRYRFGADQIEALLAIEWWNWPAELVFERREWFYRPIEEFIAEFR